MAGHKGVSVLRRLRVCSRTPMFSRPRSWSFNFHAKYPSRPKLPQRRIEIPMQCYSTQPLSRLHECATTILVAFSCIPFRPTFHLFYTKLFSHPNRSLLSWMYQACGHSTYLQVHCQGSCMHEYPGSRSTQGAGSGLFVVCGLRRSPY